MESSQVVSQSCIVPLHSRPVGLAYNLISIRNKLRVDLIAICDIEKAMLLFNSGP